MKTERNIFIAFLLNLLSSLLELLGGLWIGSVAILSDAMHDFGDACSIGIAYFLEKKSKKSPDQNYTYGYARYSVLGGAITTLILVIGSIVVIFHAISRFFNPKPIQSSGMLLFACFGVIANLIAAWCTHEKGSVNQKAVNLHMVEDVLGWVVVLIGALIIHFTGFRFLDPLLSIGVSLFILYHAAENLRDVMYIFLEKTPAGISVAEIQERLTAQDGILDVHHIHIWSIDGIHHSASMHIRTNRDGHTIKEFVRHTLADYQICHITLELETPEEICRDHQCNRPLLHTHHHTHS